MVIQNPVFFFTIFPQNFPHFNVKIILIIYCNLQETQKQDNEESISSTNMFKQLQQNQDKKGIEVIKSKEKIAMHSEAYIKNYLMFTFLMLNRSTKISLLRERERAPFRRIYCNLKYRACFDGPVCLVWPILRLYGLVTQMGVMPLQKPIKFL